MTSPSKVNGNFYNQLDIDVREDTEHENEGKSRGNRGLNRHYKDTINSGGLPAGEYPEIVLEVPPQKELVIFLQISLRLQSARVARQNPRFYCRGFD